MNSADPRSSGFTERIASRLRWRWGVKGLRAGQGRGARGAGSGEFDGHVRWCPGDELGRLDLKVWLRWGQRWTRTFRDDTNEPLTVILDGGASMGFGARGAAISRLRELLRAIARCRRDPYREWVLDGNSARPTAPDENPADATRGELGEALLRIPRSDAGPGRVVMISDRIVIDDADSSLCGLLHLGQMTWISPWLPEEIAPSRWGTIRLEAAGEPTWSGTVDRRACDSYRQLFQQYQKKLQLWLQRRGGCHVHIDAMKDGEALIRPLLHDAGPLEMKAG
jgi:hypothetical protein